MTLSSLLLVVALIFGVLALFLYAYPLIQLAIILLSIERLLSARGNFGLR